MIGAYIIALVGASLAVLYVTVIHRWLKKEAAEAKQANRS
jgi:hypothetical protein